MLPAPLSKRGTATRKSTVKTGHWQGAKGPLPTMHPPRLTFSVGKPVIPKLAHTCWLASSAQSMAASITAGLHSAGTEDRVSTATAPWSNPTIRAAPVHIPTRRHPRGHFAFGEHELPALALCQSSAMGKPLPVPPGGDGGHGELAQSQARGQGRANLSAANAACSRAAEPHASLPSPSPTSTSSRSPGARRGQLKHLGLFSCLPKLGGFVPIDACLEKSSEKETPTPRCVFSVLLEPCPRLFYQNSEPTISWDPSIPAAPRDSPHQSGDAARGPKCLARGLVTAPQHLEH